MTDIWCTGESIVREVTSQLPVGIQLFKNQREHYHITLFHTSKCFDPKPDATDDCGGASSSTPPADRPGPTEVFNAIVAALLHHVSLTHCPEFSTLDRCRCHHL